MSARRDRWLLWLALVVAYLLSALPLPSGLEPLRPYWPALVLAYFAIEAPERVGLGTAFAVGLMLDVLNGKLLGEHALGLVFVTYILGRVRLRLRFFPVWRQAFAVGAVLLNDRIVTLWIAGAAGRTLPDWRWWIAPLIGMLIWPWIFLLLDRLRHRVRS